MLRKLFVLAAGVLAAGTVAGANVVVSAGFREIVADADRIVRGQVTDVRAVDVPGRGIESVLTVAVESVVKGMEARFVYVRIPGGEIGRTRFVMVGAPRFQPGERAVFFLEQGRDAAWRPVGLSMGVFRLKVDSRTGAAVVPAPVIARVTAPVGRVTRGDPRRGSMPVTEFEALVRTVGERRTARRRGGGQ